MTPIGAARGDAVCQDATRLASQKVEVTFGVGISEPIRPSSMAPIAANRSQGAVVEAGRVAAATPLLAAPMRNQRICHVFRKARLLCKAAFSVYTHAASIDQVLTFN